MGFCFTKLNGFNVEYSNCDVILIISYPVSDSINTNELELLIICSLRDKGCHVLFADGQVCCSVAAAFISS